MATARLRLRPVDPAFHGVALPVPVCIEGWRAASGVALGFAVAHLVGFLRDRAADATFPQVGAVGAGAVGLVGQHPVRAAAGPPAARPGDADPLQHGLELRGITALARGDQH